MPVRSKYPVITRTTVFQGGHVFSPELRKKHFAQVVGETIEAIDRQNDAALARDVHYRTFVDGTESTRLETVRDDGRVVAIWELGGSVVEWIAETLAKAGPVKTGTYRSTWKLYADGVEVNDTLDVIGAKEALFVSTVAYARKIERGKKGYAPGRVYEAVAAMASARFGNIAKIKFTYAEPESPTLRGQKFLDDWAARNAAKQPTARQQRAKLSSNRRQPAILVLLV